MLRIEVALAILATRVQRSNVWETRVEISTFGYYHANALVLGALEGLPFHVLR